MRKQDLANPKLLSVGAWADKKATPGITELFQARARIDPEACYFDVGLVHPGRAAAPKGTGVHRLKGLVSWV